ncbi:MAG: hypothetical protein ACYC0V_17830 [Armatimonadota bacterium]
MKLKTSRTLKRVKDVQGSIPAPISGRDKVWGVIDQGFRFAPPMAKILDPFRVTLASDLLRIIFNTKGCFQNRYKTPIFMKIKAVKNTKFKLSWTAVSSTAEAYKALKCNAQGILPSESYYLANVDLLDLT